MAELSTSRKALLLAAFIPILPTALFCWSVWSDIRTFEQMAPFTETIGQVAHVECQNHGRYQVQYSVGGQNLTQGAGNLYLHPGCDTVQVGTSMSVWYSDVHPDYVSFVQPDIARKRMKGELIEVALIPYPVLVLFVYLTARYRWLKEKPSAA